MVPYPAQSHMNLLLQFSHVVSSYDIPVHYVGSALDNSQVKSRSSNPLHDLTKIHFHDFPISLSPDTSPPNTTTSSKTNCNSEHQVRRTEVSTHLHGPVTALLRSLSPTARRLVVVYDSLMASVVQDVVSLPNAEAYSFHSISVFAGLAFRREALEPRDNNIIPINDLPSVESCFPSAVVRNFIASQVRLSHFKAGELHNTCRAIEGSFIDQILSERKMWAVGPLHLMTIYKELIKDQDKWLLEWLDQQEPNSVLYISFGTIFTFSDEDIKEIALGLDQSGVKFIWVLRDADKVNSLSNEEARRPHLPDGFEKRMRGMGLVVREWVPQVKILAHTSIGGFMSHCGWNSCMESISMGVPIAACPMQSDQPMNALLITEVLKVGVSVREWRQRDELVTSSMISEAVRKLMASDEGEGMRKTAAEMGEKVKRSVAEGGGCRLEWDSFIAHITR
ncbi:UDP-glucuronosyl/UDP-glucosyltransferase [Parasponia andersonii]|uniref:Glycosyltransferase n=1 Tax=Parasponia andersonii TaxID=3476 RepID=A0A2P5BYR5_PARAD|nr:UDP-glucuronosyl/UDP-glucosyltransferase [Parasponia andersonii]